MDEKTWSLVHESKIHENGWLTCLETILHMIPDDDSTSEWIIKIWLVVETWTKVAKFNCLSKATSCSYWAWEIWTLLFVEEAF